MVHYGLSLALKASKVVVDIANGRHALSKLIPPGLLAADAILSALVIWAVPYTEIDWVAYMEQISQFVSGERDYTKIEGGTGPLVYPAAHVYLYTGLFYVTDRGKNILLAQQLFAILYIATLALVMACYWQAKVPPYVFPLLIMSKRLHSIFMLRCFNDCFAAFFLWLAVFLLQRRNWTLATLAYSVGLGVKMSLLLVLPAVGVILFLGRGFATALWLAVLMVQVQMLLAAPFLVSNRWGYLARAFELSRQFSFEWTVNWRFLGEAVFLSRPFSLVLLGLHACALILLTTTRWLKPSRKSIVRLVMSLLYGQPPLTEQEEIIVSQRITPRYTLATIVSANVVGLLFARSLHYQFYTYLAWSTPFLLWRSGINPILQYVLWAVQEWAWNVFPSTPFSSAIVVGILGLTTVLAWSEGGEGWEAQTVSAKPKSAKQ